MSGTFDCLIFSPNQQRQPHELYNKPLSAITVDVENPLILEGHLQCAAVEKPIDILRDLVYFGNETESICKEHLVRGEDGVRNCIRICSAPMEFTDCLPITFYRLAVPLSSKIFTKSVRDGQYSRHIGRHVYSCRCYQWQKSNFGRN